MDFFFFPVKPACSFLKFVSFENSLAVLWLQVISLYKLRLLLNINNIIKKSILLHRNK